MVGTSYVGPNILSSLTDLFYVTIYYFNTLKLKAPVFNVTLTPRIIKLQINAINTSSKYLTSLITFKINRRMINVKSTWLNIIESFTAKFEYLLMAQNILFLHLIIMVLRTYIIY